MAKIVLDDEKIRTLESHLMEMPFKYASPLMNLLGVWFRDAQSQEMVPQGAPQQLPTPPHVAVEEA